MTEHQPLLGGFGKNMTRKKSVIFFLAAILLLLTGILGAKISGSRIDRRMRKDLARQTAMLAEAIPPEEAAALSFTKEDLDRPEFIRIRQQLQCFSSQIDVDFIASFAKKNKEVVFGPESLPDTDSRATPPGTVFLRPSKDDLYALRTAEPSVQGPVEDEYGTFVRASAPVIHPRTGKALMHVVCCQSASHWRQKIRTAQWIPVIITQIPLLILAAGWILMKTRHRFGERLHRKLRHTEAFTCALVFLILTTGITAVVYHEERSNRDDAFRALASKNALIIHHALRTMENNLVLLKNLFESSTQITSSEFTAFCRPILENTMIQQATWIPNISETQRHSFEQQVQEETEWNDYRIIEQDPQENFIPAISRSVHFPALFVEPAEKTQPPRGFDVFSSPALQKAVQNAIQTDRTSAGNTVQIKTNQAILIFRKVSSASQTGVVSFSVDPSHLIRTLTLHSGVGQNHMHLCLFELSLKQPPTLLSCTDSECLDQHIEHVPPNHLTVPLFAFGKCYMLHMLPSNDWLATNPLYDTFSAAGGGLLLTLLLTSLIGVLANRPALLEKKVEQRTSDLRRAEEYARAVLDSATDAIFIHHPETGSILDFNKTAEQMFGIVRSEIGTVTLESLMAEDPRFWLAKGRPAIHRAAQGLPQLIEWTARHRNGDIFPAEICMTGTKIGGETRVIAGLRNITERKRAAERLKDSEARFRIAAEAANIGVWERDLVSSRLIWDERMFALYGYNLPTEDASKLWEKAIHPEDVKDVLAESQNAELKGGFDRQFRVLLPDGNIRYIRGIGKMLRDEKGTPSRIIGINYDVTERFLAEQALKENEARLKSLFEVAAIGISEVALDGQWIRINRKFCDITGYTREEMLKLTFQEITHPEDLTIDLSNVQLLLDGKADTYTMEKRYIRKDGSTIWVELTVSMMRKEDGSPDRFISIVSDITERKNAKEALQQRLDELHRFNRAATGRELRMIELKREINTLCKALGRDEAYPLHSL